MRHIIVFFFLGLVSLIASELDIKTFGTLGGVYNDNENYIFRKNILQKSGPSNDTYFGTDSLLGAQVNYTIDSKYSFLLQSVLEKDYKNETKIELDSLYLRYQVNDKFVFKAGRIRTPYYRNSDNQNIGYSKLMPREPIEVYGQVPFQGYNGVEVLYTDVIGEYFYSLQANYGQEEFIAPIHSLGYYVDISLENLYAMNTTFGTSDIEIRINYLSATISANHDQLDALFDGLRQNGLTALAEEYEFKNRSSKYYGIGLFIDKHNVIFESEYGGREIPGFYADTQGYYATLGYRIDRFIPYYSYAKATMKQDTAINSASDDLNNLMAIQNLAQTSHKVGLKYYISTNIDLKIQLEHITPETAYGSYYVSNSPTNEDFYVTTFLIDFVW